MKTSVWGSVSRLSRRLFILVAMVWAGVLPAGAQTVIQGPLYRADGNVASGSLTISWKSFSTSSGAAVGAGVLNVLAGADGSLNVVKGDGTVTGPLSLMPNVGATPAGSYYRVVLHLDGAEPSEENWVIPASASATVAAIRATVVPAQVAAQFVTRDALNGLLSSGAAAEASFSTMALGTSCPAGTPAGTICNISGPAVDVRAKGAKCDGVTDDSAAFAMADALGVSVLVPSGTSGACLIKSTLTLNSHYEINRGGMMALGSGAVVTMAQTPQAGLYQIFSGAGQVQFSAAPVVYPEWWGAKPNLVQTSGAADSYGALVSACASLPVVLSGGSCQATYTGSCQRAGTIKFRSMWYTMSHPWTCSSGVAYTNGNEQGQAVLELASGAVATAPAAETFAFLVDPPAVQQASQGSTLASAVSANKAQGTRLKGIQVVIDGNAAGQVTNYVSGIFVAMAQGSSIENSGAAHGWGRGCVIEIAADAVNRDWLNCTGTLNGPNVDVEGQGAFEFINSGGSNTAGTLGEINLQIAGTSYAIPYSSGFVAGSTRVRVLSGSGGSGYQAGQSAFPFRTMTRLTSGSPAQGQYVEASNGTLTFNAADVGATVRVFYQDTGVITTANTAVMPVPGVQIEAATNLHINELLSDGDYAALATNATRSLTLDVLEAHPGPAVGAGTAAVYLDSKTANVFTPAQKYLMGAQSWQYGIDDLARGVQRGLSADTVDGSYAYDSYSNGPLASASAGTGVNLSSPGAIGSATPSTAAFTSVTATSVTVSAACPAGTGAGTVCAKNVSGAVNVQAFGADNTGVADSSAAVVAAAQTVKVTAGGASECAPMVFPAGVYSMHEVDLSGLSSCAYLVGAGAEGSVRIYYNGAGGPNSYLFKFGGASYGGAQNIIFYGVPVNSGSTPTAVAQHALWFTAGFDNGGILDHNAFYNFYGDAVIVPGFTNMYARATRASGNGYFFAIRGNNSGNGNPMHLEDFTVDNSAGGVQTFAASQGYANGAVSTVTVSAAGSGMSPNGTYVIPATGGVGSGATGTAVLTGSSLTSVTMNTQGSGYTLWATVTFTGCTTNPTGTPIVAPGTTGNIAGVTITSGGNCSSAPTVTFNANPYATAYALVTIAGGAITQAGLLGEGSGYFSAPTFSLSNALSGIGGVPYVVSGTLGTLTATLGGYATGINGKGVIFCSQCNGLNFHLENVRYEHNSPDVNTGNADEGEFYSNDDYVNNVSNVRMVNFADVGNTNSQHPAVSSANGYVSLTLAPPNSFYRASSVYKNRTTQQETGDSYSGADYVSFGKNLGTTNGLELGGQRIDTAKAAGFSGNYDPASYGDWFIRSSDLVPGSNGPIYVMTSPTSGRANLRTAPSITTTATFTANSVTATNANVTGFNPFSGGTPLHVGDNLTLTNGGAGGSGSVAVTVACVDATGSGVACPGLSAQGIVVAPASGTIGCLSSGPCPSGNGGLSWQTAGFTDFGLEATRMNACPTTGSWNKGQIVWNSSPTAGGWVGCICTASGTPGTWSQFGASGSAVSSINGNAGAFSFGGSGVSCTGTNCVFSGSGGGSGTVNSGSGYSPAYYPATGAAVSGATPFSGLAWWSTSAAPQAATAAQIAGAIGCSNTSGTFSCPTLASSANSWGHSIENISASTIAQLASLTTTTSSILGVGSTVYVYDGAACGDTSTGGGSTWERLYCNAITSGVCSQWLTMECSSGSSTPQVSTPVYVPDGGTFSNDISVTVADGTSGATITYCTDTTGSCTPGTVYSAPVTINVAGTHLRSRANATGYTPSIVKDSAYVFTVAAPSDSPGQGSYSAAQTVTLADSTTGTALVYCTDTTNTCAPSTSYSSGFSVGSTSYVRYQATRSGYNSSAVQSSLYSINLTQASTPTFSVGTGTYNSTQSVTMASTAGAAICYTTNGSTPTAATAGTCDSNGGVESTYSTAVAISTTGTQLQAIATKAGLTNSTVQSATYTLTVANPTDSPGSGTYAAAQTVTLSDATSGAAFVYCTDTTNTCTPGTAYSGSFSVTPPAYLRYQATKSGFNSSSVVSSYYAQQQPISHSSNCTKMTASSVSSISCTLNNVNAGDAIVVTTAFSGNGSYYSTGITDSLGGTASVVQTCHAPNSYTLYTCVYVIKNAAAGNHTITATLNAANTYPAIIVDSFSGVSTTSPIDTYVDTGGQSAGSSVTGSSVTPTNANEMVYGFVWNNSGNMTVGGSYSYITGTVDGVSNAAFGSAYKLAGSTSAQSMTLNGMTSGWKWEVTTMTLH